MREKIEQSGLPITRRISQRITQSAASCEAASGKSNNKSNAPLGDVLGGRLGGRLLGGHGARGLEVLDYPEQAGVHTVGRALHETSTAHRSQQPMPFAMAMG